jgi:hypothetical protein
MSDAPHEPRRDVSPERLAYCKQKMIARYGPERYAEFKAAVQALAAKCTPEQWDEYVDAVAEGLRTAPARAEHFVRTTTGTPAPPWRTDRFRRMQSAWRNARREGLDEHMERWTAWARIDLRLDCGAIEFVDDAVHLFPPAYLERRPDGVARNRGRSSRGQADRKHLG